MDVNLSYTNQMYVVVVVDELLRLKAELNVNLSFNGGWGKAAVLMGVPYFTAHHYIFLRQLEDQYSAMFKERLNYY